MWLTEHRNQPHERHELGSGLVSLKGETDLTHTLTLPGRWSVPPTPVTDIRKRDGHRSFTKEVINKPKYGINKTTIQARKWNENCK